MVHVETAGYSMFALQAMPARSHARKASDKASRLNGRREELWD